MGWKNWPTWVKGGVILTIIFFLFAIPIYITAICQTITGSASNCGDSGGLFAALLLIPMLFLLEFPADLLNSPLGKILIFFFVCLLFLIQLVIVFLIGAVIGLIISKIKSRKSGETKT